MQKLSHVDFFTVCDYIRSNEARLKRLERPALLEAVREATGIPITRYHLANIQEATEVDWLVDSRRRRAIRQSEAVRILASSVADLYQRHGETVPVDVAQLAADGFTLEGGGE